MGRKNADYRRYCREIRGWLPCTRKAKRKIMDKIENVISESEGELTYGQLVERFGTPQQIASAYVDEMGTIELLNDLRIKRKILRIAGIAASVIVTVWLLAVGIIYSEGTDAVNGIIYAGEIEIIEEGKIS